MGAPLTVGVEEEFLLIDPVTRAAAPAAEPVLATAKKDACGAAGTDLHHELQSTQIEASTGICVDLDELGSRVLDARRRLAAAAQENGVRLVSAGTPVLTDRGIPQLENERFQSITERFRGVVSNYQASACHVHIGVDNPDLAVAVTNHLRPWLPTLIALSGNSPFDQGADSGYESWRAMEMSRFPGSGIPPWHGSAEDWRSHVERLVDCGVLVDDRMTFWLARPSVQWPTVEVRAADAAGTVDEAMLQAALTRALVQTALTELEHGHEGAHIDDSLCEAAVWSAARYGLVGQAIHLPRRRAMPATRVLAELLDFVRPALEETGDLPRVEEMVASITKRGTGAARQRRWAKDGTRAVVDGLIQQTLQQHVEDLPSV